MPRVVPREVDLSACLFGGQAFTWWRTGDSIEGVVRGTHVRIGPRAGTWGSTPHRPPSFLVRYLGERRTLPSALREDPDLGALARKLAGLRLLEQDPWEGFLAFMLSPVNNVPRIQENIARLSRTVGERVGEAHAIPRPEAVARAGGREMVKLGLGFRGPRLAAAAERIAAGDLDLARLARRDVAAAREELLELEGIGPKVAECILCYALAFDDAFPVDRWVERASKAAVGRALTPQEARERWGESAAMAQQLLFHGARMGLVKGVGASPMARFDGWRSLADAPAPFRP